MSTHRHASAPRRRRTAAIAAAVLPAAAALLLLVPPPAAAQTGAARKPVPGKEGGVPTVSDRPDPGLPREIGEILDTTEEARRSGPSSVRQVSRIADSIHDWLRHLQIAIVENDRPTIAYDRQNLLLLFELIQEVNPSAVLGGDLRRVRQEVGNRFSGDPLPSLLQLQLNAERFRLLYPLADMRAMTAVILSRYSEADTAACLDAVETMLGMTRLPNLDQPIGLAQRDFLEAMQKLDAGKRTEARRLLRRSDKTIQLLNVGALLVEAQWHVARAEDALRNGMPAIALASVRNADTLLRNAAERAWPEFRTSIRSVRGETAKVMEGMRDRNKKVTLTSSELRALARRIDSELRIEV